MVVALVAGGCGDSNDGALDRAVAEDAVEPVTSSSSTAVTSSITAPSTSTTVLLAEPELDSSDFPEPSDGEVFERYIASQIEAFANELRVAMADPSADPATDHPELAQYAADAYLEVNHEYLQGIAEDGTAIVLPELPAVDESIELRNRISPVMELDGDSLKILRCWVQDENFVEASTGELKAAGVLTLLAEVTMEKFEHGWKAVYSVVSEKIEGVAGCFLASDSEFPY